MSSSDRLNAEICHRAGVLRIEVKFRLVRAWTVLFGPSGSGKSTILRVIAGIERPEAGRIETAQSRIPLAPQAPTLFPHWSVFDNLTMRRKDARAQAEEMLSVCRLEDLKHKRPEQLSGGEAQRVNVARAAAWTIAGGLLLLDEPFTGLDYALRDEILRDLQAWTSAKNICVLSVTHDVAEAFQLGAEVVKVADGKVIAQGPVEVVLAPERELLLKRLQQGAKAGKEIFDTR